MSPPFLDPPAAEILSDPAPDLDTQRQMVLRTVKYLEEVIPKLPDFFAIRTTTQYEQPSPQNGRYLEDRPGRSVVARGGDRRKQLSAIGTAMRNRMRRRRRADASARKKDLNFIGVHGPILGCRAGRCDARRQQADLEPLGTGRTTDGRPSFAASVHAENPHYTVTHCCLVGREDVSHVAQIPRRIGDRSRNRSDSSIDDGVRTRMDS